MKRLAKIIRVEPAEDFSLTVWFAAFADYDPDRANGFTFA
jgi:hypothetical protein